VFLAEGLPLVPNVYVDNSLLTAVLVGVLLVWFLGERLGWPQSGLVVPGYLAGIFIIRPEVGVVIAIEGLLTYFVARFFGSILPQIGPFDRPFGRDRFLVVLLSSVAVRLFVEAGPAAGTLSALGLGDLGEMHSLGFVLVPLLANALWMPGVLKGVPLVGLPIIAVYFILSTILIPYTNLNLSDFAFTYENLSTDFLSAPRAYILLLIGAALAAHLNLRFGWEFGGILIPGLLAIAWDQPIKVLATFIEVAAIVILMRGLLITPLRKMNISGMRPLVMAFVISWLLKALVALVWGSQYPGFVASDIFGFGYLLPALLAVRCWRRGEMGRVIVPSALASYAAFILGSFISGLFQPTGLGSQPMHYSEVEGRILNDDGRRDSQELAADIITRGVAPLVSLDDLPQELVHLALDSALNGNEQASSLISVSTHPDGAILAMGDGQEKIWLRSGANSGVFFTVPEAGNQAGILEAAVEICHQLNGNGLVSAASPTLLGYLRDKGLYVIEISSGDESSLVSHGDLAPGVDLGRLSALLPQVGFSFEASEEEVLNPTLPRLSLSQEDIRRLAGLRVNTHPISATEDEDEDINSSLFVGEWSPSQHEPHSVDWLGTLDRGVLLPLIKGLSDSDIWIELAKWHAQKLGLSLTTDDEFAYLSESGDPNSSSWSLILRRGLDEESNGGLIVEVPVGGREFRTSRIGRSWFDASNGAALLLHNALADTDIFEITRQREQSPEVTILRRLVLEGHGNSVVSVRAYRQDEYPGADAVISTGEPIINVDEIPDELLRAEILVQRSGGTSTYYTAAANQLRFHDPTNFRRRVVTGAGGKWVTVYLSPTYRIAFPPLTDSPSLLSSLQAAGLDTIEFDQAEFDEGVRLSTEETQSIFGSVLEALSQYGTGGHPGQLERLVATAARARVNLSIVVEPEEELPLIKAHRGRWRLIAPLGSFQGEISEETTTLKESIEAGSAYAVEVSR